MSIETYIELTDMESTDCQWILSYGDLRHIGYVQKSSGFIQMIYPVSQEVADSIKMQVEDSLEMANLPMGQMPDTSGIEFEDAEE